MLLKGELLTHPLSALGGSLLHVQEKQPVPCKTQIGKPVKY
jgi:hypothetical protein